MISLFILWVKGYPNVMSHIRFWYPGLNMLNLELLFFKLEFNLLSFYKYLSYSLTQSPYFFLFYNLKLYYIFMSETLWLFILTYLKNLENISKNMNKKKTENNNIIEFCNIYVYL